MPRGGNRPGSGRPKSPYTERIAIRVTPENKEWLKSLANMPEKINKIIDQEKASTP